MISLKDYFNNFFIESVSNSHGRLLLEAAYTEHFDTPEEFIKFISRRYDINSEVEEFVEYVYYYWNKCFDKSPRTSPFRCTPNSNIKLARCYDTNDFLTGLPKFVEVNTNNKLKVGGITIIFGNGSRFNIRNKSGLDFEQSCRQDIIDLVYLIKESTNSKADRTEKWKSLKISKNFDYIMNLYLSGDLEDVLKGVETNPQLDISKYIVSSKDIHIQQLNNNSRLIDKMFNISNTDITKIYNDTPLYTCDIIIKSPTSPDTEKIYISNKLNLSQSSSVNISEVLQNNKTFKSAIKKELSYDEIKSINSKEMEGFNNFCNEFGLDKEDFYNKFLFQKKQIPYDYNIKLTSPSHSSKQLTKLVLGLIGNNFWLVTPTSSNKIVVNKKYTSYPIKIISARIRKPRKDSIRGVIIQAQMGSIVFDFVFRTGGDIDMGKGGEIDNSTYPYRLFISNLDVVQLTK